MTHLKAIDCICSRGKHYSPEGYRLVLVRGVNMTHLKATDCICSRGKHDSPEGYRLYLFER